MCSAIDKNAGLVHLPFTRLMSDDQRASIRSRSLSLLNDGDDIVSSICDLLLTRAPNRASRFLIATKSLSLRSQGWTSHRNGRCFLIHIRPFC